MPGCWHHCRQCQWVRVCVCVCVCVYCSLLSLSMTQRSNPLFYFREIKCLVFKEKQSRIWFDHLNQEVIGLWKTVSKWQVVWGEGLKKYECLVTSADKESLFRAGSGYYIWWKIMQARIFLFLFFCSIYKSLWIRASPECKYVTVFFSSSLCCKSLLFVCFLYYKSLWIRVS